MLMRILFTLWHNNNLHDFILFGTDIEVITLWTCSSDSERKHAYKMLLRIIRCSGCDFENRKELKSYNNIYLLQLGSHPVAVVI